MKRLGLRYWFVSVLSALLLGGCVHEWPDENATVPVRLDLSFATAMPLYTTINLNSRVDVSDYDVRYIVSVYRGGSGARSIDRDELYRFTFTKDNVATLDHSLSMDIHPGEYTFLVWADYVRAGSTEDLYYDTSDFEEIKLQGNHVGNNDFRDAFRGEASAVVGYSSEPVPVEMERPLAKFNFISVDLPEFISRVLAMIQQREQEKKAEQEALAANSDNSLGSDSNGLDDEDGVGADEDYLSNGSLADEGTKGETRVNLENFTVVFSYFGSMPSSFNMFTNQPADVSYNVTFESRIAQISENEAELGFDYVFVNGHQSWVNVGIAVYDEEGVKVSSTNPVEVPIVRSKLTTVRHTFLTSMTSEGVTVHPDFDGDHPYVVP